jgi:hypothetical protein
MKMKWNLVERLRIDSYFEWTHLFPCVFLLLPPLENFLLVTDVVLSFDVSSGTGKLVAYPCSCSVKGIRIEEKFYNHENQKIYVMVDF